MRFFSIIPIFISCSNGSTFDELAVCTRPEMMDYPACRWLAQFDYPEYIDDQTVAKVVESVDRDFLDLHVRKSIIPRILDSRFAPLVLEKQEEALSRFIVVMMARRAETEVALEKIREEIAETRMTYADLSSRVQEHDRRFGTILRQLEALRGDGPEMDDYLSPRLYRMWEDMAFRRTLELQRSSRDAITYHMDQILQLIASLRKDKIPEQTIYRIFYKSLKIIRDKNLHEEKRKTLFNLEGLKWRAQKIEKRIQGFMEDMERGIELLKDMKTA